MFLFQGKNIHVTETAIIMNEEEEEEENELCTDLAGRDRKDAAFSDPQARESFGSLPELGAAHLDDFIEDAVFHVECLVSRDHDDVALQLQHLLRVYQHDSLVELRLVRESDLLSRGGIVLPNAHIGSPVRKFRDISHSISLEKPKSA